MTRDPINDVRWSILCSVMALLESSYIPYDSVEGADSDQILPGHYKSPEELVIRKDLYEKLGKEGRELLSLMINRPKEVLTPKTQKLTERSLVQYLRKRHWHEVRIKKAMSKVMEYSLHML